jgi:hypothetical protein
MNESERYQWQAPLAILLSVAAVALLLLKLGGSTSVKAREVSYSEFVAEVRADHLADVKVTGQDLVGRLKEEAAKARGGNRQITTTRLPNLDDPALLKDLEAQQVKVTAKVDGYSWLW